MNEARLADDMSKTQNFKRLVRKNIYIYGKKTRITRCIAHKVVSTSLTY